MDVNVYRLDATRDTEFLDLLKIFKDVFELGDVRIPPAAYRTELLSNAHFLSFAAVLENEVIGGITAYILPRYFSMQSVVYIYDLAVMREHQRKGIGGQLVDAINEYAKARGYEEVFVQADRSDDHALDFYRKTRPESELDAVHFSYAV